MIELEEGERLLPDQLLIQHRTAGNIRMTSINPNSGFKVTVFVEGEYLKNGALWDKVTIGLLKIVNRKLGMLWNGTSLDDIDGQDLKVTEYFHIKYVKNWKPVKIES